MEINSNIMKMVLRRKNHGAKTVSNTEMKNQLVYIIMKMEIKRKKNGGKIIFVTEVMIYQL